MAAAKGSRRERSSVPAERQAKKKAAEVAATPVEQPEADNPMPEKTRRKLDKKTQKEQKELETIIQKQAVVRRRLYRDLDAKKAKPTKKQKELLSKWRGKNLGRQVDSIIKSLADQGQRKFGNRAVAIGKESDNVSVCIPVPFPFEYLIQQDGLPCGVTLVLCGPSHSCKTSLTYEGARWFKEAGGLTAYTDNEPDKQSPDLGQSILGSDYNSLLVTRSDSAEGWQEATTYWVQKTQAMMTGTKENPGPGRTVPVMFAVDGITSKLSRDSSKKIAEDGYASRAFAHEALIHTRYMQFIPQQIGDWPFLLWLVNQLKKKKDMQGNDISTMAGGAEIEAKACFLIESVVTQNKIEFGKYRGRKIQLRCKKNSMGDNSRRIDVRMMWTHQVDPETGLKRQVTEWDWGWATVQLLQQAKGELKEQIEGVVDLHITATGDATCSAWSRRLGISKKEPLSWSEVGKRIVADPEIVNALRDIYNIKPRALLRGNVDYLEQVDQQLAKVIT